jgi:glutamyl-tRNA reductase
MGDGVERGGDSCASSENASVAEREGVHILVLGAGALGSIIAAHLIRAGETVTVLARGLHTEARQDGRPLCLLH